MFNLKIFGKIVLAFVATMSIAMSSLYAVPVQAETATCSVADQGELMVKEGLTVHWDNTFECADVPLLGDYEFSVGVALEGSEEITDQQIVIDNLVLSEVIPSEEGDPLPTINVSGLPLILLVGEDGTIDVSGAYELMEQEGLPGLTLVFLASGMVETVGETPTEGEVLEEDLFELEISLTLTGETPEEEEPEDGETNQGYFCIQSDIQHPVGARLAAQYGVDYATLQGWFCEGFGWGQIKLALQTGVMTGGDPGTLLEERSSGLGWGEIWMNLGLKGKSNSEPDDEEISVDGIQEEVNHGKSGLMKQLKDIQKGNGKDKGKGKNK